MKELTSINCGHPVEKIRVVMHIVKNVTDPKSKVYRVEKGTAHCTMCNSNLQETDKNGKLAIDIAFSAKEPHVMVSNRSSVRRSTSR